MASNAVLDRPVATSNAVLDRPVAASDVLRGRVAVLMFLTEL
jgi:hypothetical protein